MMGQFNLSDTKVWLGNLMHGIDRHAIQYVLEKHGFSIGVNHIRVCQRDPWQQSSAIVECGNQHIAAALKAFDGYRFPEITAKQVHAKAAFEKCIYNRPPPLPWREPRVIMPKQQPANQNVQIQTDQGVQIQMDPQSEPAAGRVVAKNAPYGVVQTQQETTANSDIPQVIEKSPELHSPPPKAKSSDRWLKRRHALRHPELRCSKIEHYKKVNFQN